MELRTLDRNQTRTVLVQIERVQSLVIPVRIGKDEADEAAVTAAWGEQPHLRDEQFGDVGYRFTVVQG